MSLIICGSKKYNNRNFDELVDSFEVIVRSNMLLPDMGYGKKDSTIQVCNNHVYDHYQRKAGSHRHGGWGMGCDATRAI